MRSRRLAIGRSRRLAIGRSRRLAIGRSRRLALTLGGDNTSTWPPTHFRTHHALHCSHPAPPYRLRSALSGWHCSRRHVLDMASRRERAATLRHMMPPTRQGYGVRPTATRYWPTPHGLGPLAPAQRYSPTVGYL